MDMSITIKIYAAPACHQQQVLLYCSQVGKDLGALVSGFQSGRYDGTKPSALRPFPVL